MSSSNGNPGSGLASESETSGEESDLAVTSQIKRESNAPSGSRSTSSSTSDDESDEDSKPEMEEKDCRSSSSSEEESSADEIVIEQKTIVELKASSSSLGNNSKLQTSQNRNAASLSSSSSSSSSESDENAKEFAPSAAKKVLSASAPPRPKTSTATAKNNLGPPKSGSGTRTNTVPPPVKEKKDKRAFGALQNRPETSIANTVTSSAKDTTIHENDEKKVTKKRRMDVDGGSVVTAVATPLKLQKRRNTRKDSPLVEGDPEAADAVTIERVEVTTRHGISVKVPLFANEAVLGAKNTIATAALSSGKDNKGGKVARMTNNRFMRVDPTKMQPAMDNSYISKVRHQLPL